MKDEQLFDAFANIDGSYLMEKRPRKPKRLRFLWLTVLFSILALLIVMAFLFPMSNAWNYPYTVEQIDGRYYLQMHGDWWDQYLEPGSFWYTTIWKWNEEAYTFRSTNEMRDAFLSGNLHQYGGNSLYSMIRDGGKKHLIPDLDDLFRPIFPADVQHDGSVKWSWYDSYSFPFSCQLSQDCYITLHSVGTGVLAEENRKPYTVHEYDPVRDIHVDVLHNQGQTFLFYELTEGSHRIIVEETVNDEDGSLASVRCVTWIGGIPCCIQLNAPAQVPTAQWIHSFGLEPVQ